SVCAGPALVGAPTEPAVPALGPAVAPTVFCCVTVPLFPGLSTRTTTLMFVGEVWVALASAWPPPTAPFDAVVPVAPAPAFALFPWPTGAMSPGLPTRTCTFALLGESCVVDEVAIAFGLFAFAEPFELP